MTTEMLKELAHRLAQTGHIPDFDAGCPRQPHSDLRLAQVEHQIVRPQARDVAVSVKSGKRVIKIIG